MKIVIIAGAAVGMPVTTRFCSSGLRQSALSAHYKGHHRAMCRD